MSRNSKIVWSEGMFLQPQHFQQHDRYLQNSLEIRTGQLRPYAWGFTELTIDESQLGLGKLALSTARGVMPDGTPFNMPADDDLPPPIDLPPEARGALVVLALPIRRPGVPETWNEDSLDNFARYRTQEVEVRDSNGQDNHTHLQVGKLRFRLALETEVKNAYSSLGVARVVERQADNRIQLELEYYPPCLDYRIVKRLAALTDEMLGMLKQRADTIAARLNQPGITGAAEIADFLMLQLINRFEPLFFHLCKSSGQHPETLYQAAVQLAGEMATFGAQNKRCRTYPEYQHDKLAAVFAPVFEDLRRYLSIVMDAHAVQIKLEERNHGIRVAQVPDTELLKSAAFVLAVSSQQPAETVRTYFPQHVKIGPIEKIRDLVNLQLPGIGLRALAVAPRQLPFHAGFTYFELDRGSEFWKMLTAAGFAMHVAGDFPGLQMEFWAIRR
ncbi:type VI secretion system baseplate subunit TssK [Massilia sp. W12]|uniref:type VI secretion system baseplate subunit TssK n=1 Tax=Massilia sp. W12 TaxID=3126507 RepID=UPI0030CCB77B